jgi:succinate dehydrogenase hydrophobic anchor subunit
MIHRLNKFFINIHSLDGLIHWLIQRSTAITILMCLFLVFIFDSLTIFSMLGSLLVFHISAGIQTLIDDYIHDPVLFLLSVTYLRITALFLFKTLFVIFIC